jgi:hypothetical protein
MLKQRGAISGNQWVITGANHLKVKDTSGFSMKQYLVSIALFSLLILLRKPTLHPQFWAEDGVWWYKEAYLSGVDSLFAPKNGYLQTISRLAGLFSLNFEMLYAPLVFYLIALAAQVSPVAVFLSKRFDGLVPNIKLRLFICLCYVLIPNSWEVNMNITNAQWHLALLSFLLIVGREPRQAFLKTIDYAALIISGLSGPFSLFLFPIALFELYRQRTMEAARKAFVVGAAAAVQLVLVSETMGATRSSAPLGASVDSFLQIVGNNILVGGILGKVETMGIIGSSMHALNYVIVPAGLTLMGIAVARGPVIYREFMFFAFAVIGCALIKPQVSLTEPQWPLLEGYGTGCNRYYVIPIIAWMVTLIVLSFNSGKITRSISRALIVLMLVVFPVNFLYLKNRHPDFSAEAIAFQNAKPGTEMDFQEDPPGWHFVLTKK